MTEIPGSAGTEEVTRRLPIAPFLEVLTQRRGMIIALTFGAAVVAALFSLVSPITYESSLTILPPEQSSSFGLGAGGIQSSLANLQIGFAKTNASALYADMLRSRSVRRYVVEKLDLIEVYGLGGLDSLKAHTYALGTLDTDVAVTTFRNGLIIVQALAHTGSFPGAGDKDAARLRAAAIANAMAEGLEVVNREKNTNQARRARLYLEGQLAQTSAALETASLELASFQREHMAISLDDQMRVGIETIGNLEGEVLAREVTLGVALQTMSSENPAVRGLKNELAALRQQLANLQRGIGTAPSTGSDSMNVGLDAMPEIARQYALRLRDVKIQERLYELLTEQLYHARIKETETLPVIQVLDEAAVPIFKKSPIVRKVTVIAAILGFLLAVLLAHVLHWWGKYEWRTADAEVLRRLWRR